MSSGPVPSHQRAKEAKSPGTRLLSGLACDALYPLVFFFYGWFVVGLCPIGLVQSESLWQGGTSASVFHAIPESVVHAGRE